MHGQVYVDFLVIEPARDLHPTAVHASITPLSVHYGEGHIAICHRAQQLVAGAAAGVGSPILPGHNGVGALVPGHLAFTPTEVQGTIGLGVIATRQSDIVPHKADHTDGAVHCGIIMTV